MVTLINRYNKDRHTGVLAAMHAARKRVPDLLPASPVFQKFIPRL